MLPSKAAKLQRIYCLELLPWKTVKFVHDDEMKAWKKVCYSAWGSNPRAAWLSLDVQYVMWYYIVNIDNESVPWISWTQTDQFFHDLTVKRVLFCLPCTIYTYMLIVFLISCILSMQTCQSIFSRSMSCCTHPYVYVLCIGCIKREYKNRLKMIFFKKS